MQAYHDPTYMWEIWSLFVFGTLFMTLRTIVRIRTVGIRNFQGDDYVILAVMLCYVGDAVTVTMAYHLGTNLDYTQEQFAAMTPAEIHTIGIGSRMETLAWFSYSTLIWALKTCVLFFYYRLTSGLHLQRYVKWLAWACGLSFLAVFLTLSCGCFPIQKNWQVMPDPGYQCTFKPQNFYVVSILNIITDSAILCVPMPMIWMLRVDWKRKAGLSLLLFPGVFVITAALIRIVMSLSANPSALNVNRWGVRETVAGIVCVNLPILRPLFLKAFWKPGFDFNDRSNERSSKPSGKHTSSFGKATYEMFGSPHETLSSRHRHGKLWATATAVLKETEDDMSSPEDASSERSIMQRPHDNVRGTLHRSSTLEDDVESGLHGVLVETSFARVETAASAPQVRHELPSHPWEVERTRAAAKHGNDVFIHAGRSGSTRI